VLERELRMTPRGYVVVKGARAEATERKRFSFLVFQRKRRQD